MRKWIDKYLIFGVLFLVIQYLIFKTFDFAIFSWFRLHHVFELVGFLLFGFWLANSERNISSIKVIVAYIPAVIVMSILISGSITISGVFASAIVSSPLLIGYWLRKE